MFQLLVGSIIWTHAQIDSTIVQPPDATQEIIEDFLQNTDSEGEFDFNTIFEELEIFLKNPIDLNKATAIELQDLRLLNDVQINNLQTYIQKRGDLLAIYELQAIPGFDLETIRRIQPFITVNKGIEDYYLPITEMVAEGSNEVFFRWSRVLEEQKGYIPLEEGQSGSRYLGDPNRLYFRYKHSYSNKLSYGITADKDRGEAFFKGSNPQGFDFYSAHFYLRNYNQNIKAIAIGDYSISMGQGLILFNGFSQGKSSSPMLIKRTGRAVRPYTSVNEADFLRGAATTIGLGNLDVTAFVSSKKSDANLIIPTDTVEGDFIVREFTSLREDGLHRTQSEIDDENAVTQFNAGGSLKWRQKNWHIALNSLYTRFDKELASTIRPYNKFYFRGQTLLNTSLDYSILLQNFNFFGETAMSDNGAIATVNGVIIGLDRKVDFSVLFRHFPKDYQALNADPFAETSGARNETGLYFGLDIRPDNNWLLSGYFDVWRHPWIRFNADAPYNGFEYRARITHFKKRTYRIYLEFREEHKFTNAPANDTKIDFIIPTVLFQTRLHISNKITPSLELRSRVDFGYFKNEAEGTQRGFSILQDVIYQPIDFPIHFTTRFALFDTPGFDVRFYHYENDLLYTFSIPPYYNKGSRFYFNVRYRGIRNMVLEGRIAQTFWRNRDTFGSSLEEINGPARTQVAAQIKYKF